MCYSGHRGRTTGHPSDHRDRRGARRVERSREAVERPVSSTSLWPGSTVRPRDADRRPRSLLAAERHYSLLRQPGRRSPRPSTSPARCRRFSALAPTALRRLAASRPQTIRGTRPSRRAASQHFARWARPGRRSAPWLSCAQPARPPQARRLDATSAHTAGAADRRARRARG